ncbi:hypothetical protein ACFX15_012571 [Malus domestica]|uniref:F-box protein At5g07610-like n=1 Tax=Malus sylvestris TaxID=3752 RepID=UPI000498FD99|nr:F-box protein At5g07610-like [Malus domestica]XP_050120156.1 F-box protein At5g07610-like [Malus sylvestris]
MVASAEVVACNEDLITLILLRLPVKSLLRFKCVSKKWLCLISTPNFSSRHRRLASASILLSQIPGLISHLSLNCSSSEKPFSSLDFIDDSAGVKLLQSINGLALGCSFHKLGKPRSYYVCNPSTRQFLTLPPPNAEGHDSFATVLGVYLAFDSSKSPHYQVVCVRNCSLSAAHDRYQIQIYPSETRTWRLCGSPFASPSDMMFETGVLWNGAIHWISPTGATLCFNINQEHIGSMPSPPSDEHWSKRRFRYFGESGGHLHLVEIYGPSTTQFQVFELERDYSKWICKYQIDISPIIDAFPEMVRDYLHPHHHDSLFYAFVLLFVQETEEGSSLLLHIPGKFISYNLRNKSFKEICGSGPKSTKTNTALHIGCFHAHQFIETLASV